MWMVQLPYNAKMMDPVIAINTSMEINVINAWSNITTFLLAQVCSIKIYLVILRLLRFFRL